MKSTLLTLTTSPTLVAEGGVATVPKSVIIQNPSGATSIFVGDENVTTANGIIVVPETAISVDMVAEKLYACVAAGTHQVRVLEVN